MFRVADEPLLFRSSVAAFYARLLHLFYRSCGCGRWGRFPILCRLVRVDPEVEKIIHRMPEILFAAEIAFRGLDRGVPQQKLNLLKLTAAVVAQLRTSSPQIMRRDVL